MKKEGTSWTFCLLWIVAGIVGLGVGAAAILGLWKVLGSPPHKALMGVLVGGGVGTMQWLVLRGQLPRVGLWVVATAVGWAVGAAVELISSFFFSIVVLAILVGVLQWVILRRELIRAGWWIAASMVSWAAFVGVVGTLGRMAGSTAGKAASFGVAFAVVGTITGATLLWLLRQSAVKGGK